MTLKDNNTENPFISENKGRLGEFILDFFFRTQQRHFFFPGQIKKKIVFVVS